MFNKIKYLNITDNDPDAMHDILEGVVPFTLKLVIKRWVVNKTNEISAKFISNRIKRF